MPFKNPLAQSIDLIKTLFPPLSDGFFPLRKKEECEEDENKSLIKGIPLTPLGFFIYLFILRQTPL